MVSDEQTKLIKNSRSNPVGSPHNVKSKRSATSRPRVSCLGASTKTLKRKVREVRCSYLTLQCVLPSRLDPQILDCDKAVESRRQMAKRQAEEALEDVVAKDSPASKKARVGDFPEPPLKTNRVRPTPAVAPTTSNGHRSEADKTTGDDILAPADHEYELREEAAVLTDPDEVQDEESAYSTTSRQAAPLEGYTDLYLDTINRSVLDFDFEKLCSVTLSNINVYACLVCGKYYQGRGPRSHAYFHALEVGHHVYVNMQTKRVYVLPEGYEVKSKSLEDIKFVVDPQLSREEVNQLDKEAKDAWDINGKRYRPGKFRYLLSALKSY